MKQKFYQFMQGRYGADAFSRFLTGLVFVFLIISFFTPGNFLYLLSLLLLIYSYFRMFSKNIPKRYAENVLYMKYQNKVTAKFRSFTTGLKQRKTHHIYKCPSCHQKIRVPKGHGKIAIHCPKCNAEFIRRS